MSKTFKGTVNINHFLVINPHLAHLEVSLEIKYLYFIQLAFLNKTLK